MMKKLESLDPVLAIGLVISVALAVILVLLGQDEVLSLMAGLIASVITLLIDVIARLGETEKRILRGTALGDLLLDDQELHHILQQIAVSYQAVQRSGFALFIERSRDVVLDCKEVLGAMERGYTVVEVGGKYAYGTRGTRTAQKTVQAVDYEDIEAWRSVYLQDVIRVNAEAVKNGTQIQRVFILTDDSALRAKDVLDAHKNAGVQVFTISPDDLPSTQLLESFLVVDGEVLVIFYYTRDGRAFREERVSIDSVEVDRAVSRFHLIMKRAKPYPLQP